jgi:hypothetical protein
MRVGLENTAPDCRRMDDTSNPYAAPKVEDLTAEVHPDAVSIRMKYLSHEASIKSMGTLFYLGGGLGMLVIAGLLTQIWRATQSLGFTEILIIGIGVSMGIVQLLLAHGLRHLQRWARIPAAAVSVLMLFSVPIGTLIGSYFLYLLLSQKGVTVFSDSYQQVIAQTPHVRFQTSRITVMAMIVLLVVLAFVVGGVVFISLSQ